MVDIRNIEKHETPPSGSSHVLIEKVSGRFRVIGFVAGKKEGTFFVPNLFDDLANAIAASRRWAEDEDVPVIYVKDIP
jgi:hypothetical protein